MKRENRKRRVAAGAQDIIQKEGHFNLTLNKLSSWTGVPYATLYRDFESISNLLPYSAIRLMKAIPNYLIQLDRIKLTNKERLIAVACLPFYSCLLSKSNDGMEAIFNGGNSVLLNEASPEYIQKIKSVQCQLYQMRWAYFCRCTSTGVSAASEEELKLCYRMLHLLSRGSAFAAYHDQEQDNEFSLSEVIGFAQTIVDSLPWNPVELVDPRRVQTAIRTIHDRCGSSLHWPNGDGLVEGSNS